MIDIFDKKYKAISNLFIKTYEEKDYTFPSPLSFIATIENEKENKKNRVEIVVPSYYDSVLILDHYFNVFAYLLTFDYKIDSIIFNNLVRLDINSDTRGYKGIYSFINEDVSMNLGQTEIYDNFIKGETNDF